MKHHVTNSAHHPLLAGLLLTVACGFALHGCRQLDESVGELAGGSTPLVVLAADMEQTAPAGRRTVTSAPTTRAVTSVEVKDGKLALFLRGKAGTGYTDKNNLPYVYGSPAWTPDGAANTLYLGAEAADVCAYYPYNNDGTCDDPEAIPLTSQVFSTDAANLSYAAKREMDGSSTRCKTSFTLKRAYAKLGFTFTRDNYPSAGKLTQIKLANCHTKASVNILEGTFAEATTVAELANTVSLTIPADKSAVTTEDGSSTKNSLLIVPGTIPAHADDATRGAEVILTVDDKEVRVLIPTSLLGKWEAGKAYDCKIKLTGTGIEVMSVETKDWNTNVVQDDGDKPFVPEEEEEEEEVIGGIPVVFRNSMGDEKTVIFAKSQLYYNKSTGEWGLGNEQCDYGYVENNIAPGDNNMALVNGTISYYFMYGKLEGCIGTSISGYYTGSENLFDVNLDPCQKMGDKWISPTSEIINMLCCLNDYHPVDENGQRMSSYGSWSSYTPTDGRTNKSAIPGRWLNTSSPSGTQYNSSRLFLPAAGYRNTNGTTMGGVGSDGPYWSSQPNGSRAYYLYFDSRGCRLIYGGRNYGFPVRCCLLE